MPFSTLSKRTVTLSLFHWTLGAIQRYPSTKAFSILGAESALYFP